jgi:putative glutamine amidotransferase
MGVARASARCDGGGVNARPPDRRPRLFVSNVVSRRPGARRFHDAVTMLSNSLVQSASGSWDVTWAFAEDDGPARTLDRARDADAIILMGGEDISPDLYGAAPGYPGEGPHWRRADLAQIALARFAVADGVPLLGVCRGLQILAVALGGSLVEDVDVPGHRSATFLDDHRLARHDVLVEASSMLARGIPRREGGADWPDPGGRLRLRVHSAHHQAVADPGPHLVVSATAPDGTVEGVEHPAAPVLGVQWHPEDPAADPAGLRALLGLLREGREGAIDMPGAGRARPVLV